jgi:hypothetical protein
VRGSFETFEIDPSVEDFERTCERGAVKTA